MLRLMMRHAICTISSSASASPASASSTTRIHWWLVAYSVRIWVTRWIVRLLVTNMRRETRSTWLLLTLALIVSGVRLSIVPILHCIRSRTRHWVTKLLRIELLLMLEWIATIGVVPLLEVAIWLGSAWA